MEAASVPWRPIGQLFVARGVITQDQLEEALAEQAASGKRLGEILVDRQLISSPELTQALMEQLGRQVAKEDGFGSGLWAEIQRRTARGEGYSALALVEDSEPPADGPASRDGFAARAAEARSTELTLHELEVEHEDSSPEPQAELEAMSRRLEAYEAAIDSLTGELEDARAAVDARKEMLDREAEARQELRHGVDAVRECLAEMRAQLTEINLTIASLSAAKEEQEAAAHSAGERVQTELDSIGQELDARTARVAQLERELATSDGRVGELERLLEETQHDRDATDERRIAAEWRVEEVERRFSELQATRTGSEAELRAAESGISELDGEVDSLRSQLVVADATLEEERAAHERTGKIAEQLAEERARSEEELLGVRRELENVRHAFRDRAEAVESELRRECENHAATRDQLDETLADLTKTTAKLHDTEAASAEIAVRAAQLSEEQAAAAETRVAALDARLAEEQAASAETRSALALALSELAARGVAAVDREQPSCADYLCFAPGKKGYRLVPASGAMPGVGDRHELRGADYVVTRVGPSPLPSDQRRCAYLQAS